MDLFPVFLGLLHHHLYSLLDRLAQNKIDGTTPCCETHSAGMPLTSEMATSACNMDKGLTPLS